MVQFIEWLDIDYITLFELIRINNLFDINLLFDEKIDTIVLLCLDQLLPVHNLIEITIDIILAEKNTNKIKATSVFILTPTLRSSSDILDS